MLKSNCNTQKQALQTQKNEKVTLIVVIITLLTMFAEIIAGIMSGSMALLSDGIHMGTHSIALFITLAAYIFARKHINNPKYSFGTGKVGVLGGYTNAILLLLAGGAMAVLLLDAGDLTEEQVRDSVMRIGGSLGQMFVEAEERDESPVHAAQRLVRSRLETAGPRQM
jgi:divalent metal cation (Fe/Co/Zn/Cd) transporter